MGSYVRENFGAVSLSILMHLAIVVMLVFSVSFGRSRVVTAPQPSAIEVVLVDQNPAAVLAEMRDAERVERERVERERVEQERAEQERVDQERVRLEQEQQQREEVERQARLDLERANREEAERLAAEEAQQRDAEARRLEEEQRLREERLAEEQRLEQERLEQERLEEERRLAEERRRREAEEQALMEALAAEESARQAEQQAIEEARRTGEFDRYIRRIQVAIEQAWIPPASAGPGLECIVYVTQIPSGDVTSVEIGSCNGDAAVRRSIEAAVLRASPLPTPGIAALFDRNLEVTFRPQF